MQTLYDILINKIDELKDLFNDLVDQLSVVNIKISEIDSKNEKYDDIIQNMELFLEKTKEINNTAYKIKKTSIKQKIVSKMGIKWGTIVFVLYLLKDYIMNSIKWLTKHE